MQELRYQHKASWSREESRKLNQSTLQEGEKFKKILAKAAESDLTVRTKFAANRGVPGVAAACV